MGKVNRIVDTCDICGIESLNKIPLCPICKKQVCAMCSSRISVFVEIREEGVTYRLVDSTSDPYRSHNEECSMSACNECGKKIKKELTERIKTLLKEYGRQEK